MERAGKHAFRSVVDFTGLPLYNGNRKIRTGESEEEKHETLAVEAE
ncbi:MAG: hypothetical protein HFE60_04685 [Anaerotignum sp.]|nr:hypothetical protein [Anaerotignum sp.]